MPVSSDACTVPGWTSPLRSTVDPWPALSQAGGAEELREVEPDTAAIDAVAEGDRHQDADQGAPPGRGAAAGLVERGEQEDDGFEALAQHREEGHADHRQRAARRAVHRVGGHRLELALELARVLTHPDHHVGDHRHGERPDDGLQAFLLALRQVVGEHLQRHADADAQDDRDGDPGEHPADQVAATLLAQERRDDADDEGRLEPFPQTDDEGGQHAKPFGS
jgi:hypothetical protein